MATKTDLSSVSKEAAKFYLLREYKTACDIVDVASKFTSKIKNIYWMLVSGCMSLFVASLLTSSSILYEKYNECGTCFSLDLTRTFRIITLIYCAFLVLSTIVLAILDMFQYSRQRTYRLLKTKLSNDILEIENSKETTFDLGAKVEMYNIIKKYRKPLECSEKSSVLKEILVFLFTIIVVFILLILAYAIVK